MSRINIGYMTEAACKELKVNLEKYKLKFLANPTESSWIENLAGGKVFEEKRWQIDDFKLEMPESAEDTETLTKNAILMYEKLKHLPRYVLSNRYFWLWFMFNRCYSVALIMMRKKKTSSFYYQWLHPGRRGLFLGIISRSYYLVALTVDEKNLYDPYYLTRFSFQKFSWYRGINWRKISNNEFIVRAYMRAIYDAFKEQASETFSPRRSKWFDKLPIDLGKKGSIQLLDMMTEEDIYKYISEKIKEYW